MLEYIFNYLAKNYNEVPRTVRSLFFCNSRLVGEYCKNLQFLNVNDCRSVTEASLARLRVRGLQIDVQASTWQQLRRLSNTFPYARPCINLQI